MSGFPFPVIVTAAGLQPIPPSTLLAGLLSAVSAINPGYTTLPATLIEDISSTDVGAMITMNQSMVDLVNSVSPLGANEALLTQLGGIYGISLNQGANGSVNCVFTGPPGFAIPVGFTVTDTSGNQYTVQTAGVIASGGSSAPIYCVATQAGTFPIGVGTVTTISTSTPGYVLTVTNPIAGTPGTGQLDYFSYRPQVLQAGLAVAQSFVSFLQTQLLNVPGTQAQTIGVLQTETNQWQILCGSGDPYQVAFAISQSIQDFNNIVGSILTISGVTQASIAVVTTALLHGYASGQTTTITGVVGMTELNANTYYVNVISPFTFGLYTDSGLTMPVNSSGYSAYVSGGVCSPNPRNRTVAIINYPNTYDVTYVVPPVQPVTIALTWNTNSINAVSATTVAALGASGMAGYINGIPVGQPINLFELQAAFQLSVNSVLPIAFLTKMIFVVTINGVGVSPLSDTGIIAADPEGSFQTTTTAISIVQG